MFQLVFMILTYIDFLINIDKYHTQDVRFLL